MKNELNKPATIKLTPLRQDVLTILRANKKPMGAYDILNKLKRKRPNAEPPTVYRVLDRLVEAKVIHRIEAQNAYVTCSHSADDASQHKAILFLCKSCAKSYEYEEVNIFNSISQFADKHALEVDDALIELKGLCQTCLSK
ncbi:MAG: Fur family transcriptional regulator [Gammaproteobacteria bacterium]